MPKKTKSGSSVSKRAVASNKSKTSSKKTTAFVAHYRHKAEELPDTVKEAKQTFVWRTIGHYDDGKIKLKYLESLVKMDPSKNPDTVLKFENQTYREEKLEIPGSDRQANYLVYIYSKDEKGRMKQTILNFKMFEALTAHWGSWSPEEVRKLKFFMTQNSKILNHFGHIVNGPKEYEELISSYKEAIGKQIELEKSKKWKLEHKQLDIKKELKHLTQQELNLLIASAQEERFQKLFDGIDLIDRDEMITTMVKGGHVDGVTFNKGLWLLRAYRQMEAQYSGTGLDIEFLSPSEKMFYTKVKVINPKKQKENVEVYRFIAGDPYLGEYIKLKDGREVTRLQKLISDMEIHSQAGYFMKNYKGTLVKDRFNLDKKGNPKDIPVRSNPDWFYAWERFREYYYREYIREKDIAYHKIAYSNIPDDVKKIILKKRVPPRPEFDISEEEAEKTRLAHVSFRKREKWLTLTKNQKLDAQARREIAEQKREKRIKKIERTEERLKRALQYGIETERVKEKVIPKPKKVVMPKEVPKPEAISVEENVDQLLQLVRKSKPEAEYIQTLIKVRKATSEKQKKQFLEEVLEK